MRPALDANPALNPRIWNSGQHGNREPRSRIDDVRFFDVLLGDVSRRWPIDRRRIYVAGHSNGAAMAFRLACERSDRYTAIAAASAHCWVPDPHLTRPVPTLWLVGTKDPLMPIDGGMSVLPWEVRRTPPLSDTLEMWARANGCKPLPAHVETKPGLIQKDYGPSAQDVRIRLVLLNGHGHTWAGHPETVIRGGRAFYGPDTARIDATDWCWEFFRTRTLERV